MTNTHQTLNYGPAHVDPIVRLNDGASSILEIGDKVRQCLADGIPVVHIVLRMTNDHANAGDRRLHEPDLHVIRNRLNETLQGAARVCVRPNGNLEAVSGGLNYLHPDDVQQHIGGYCGSLISHPESVFDVSEQFWMDHVHGARAALTEKRQKQSGHLPPSQIESLLSGRSAEFIMQHVLERYLAPPPNPEDAQAHLIHRRRSLRFPEGPHSTDASHHLHFRTLYNCELNRTQRTGSAHGNKPFHTSSLTLTEFDALATTGLDPEHPELFHTLYAFEATTMSKLEEKMKDKESKLRPFKEDMNHRGINLHVFHVLLHSRQIAPEQLAKMVNAPIPPDTHLLALPLISSVDRVVRRTAKELKVKLS